MCAEGPWFGARRGDREERNTHFTVDKDTFVPVSSSIFTRSFDVVLGLICTFRTKVRSSLGDRMHLLPERCDGSVVQWCLYLHTNVCTDEHGTFKYLKRMNQTCGGLQFYSEVFAYFFLFSHDVKQRGTECEGRP